MTFSYVIISAPTRLGAIVLYKTRIQLAEIQRPTQRRGWAPSYQ
jgi:hypothetical protein